MRISRITIYLWLDLFERDFTELPAGTFAEPPNAAYLRGFAENESAEVAKLSEAYDIMEALIIKFDKVENINPRAIALRTAFTRAEKRLSDARARLAIAVENHTSFVTASIAASRPLGAADGKGKATTTATDEEELLDNPKFLKRKLPEPSKGRKSLAHKPHKAHASAAAFCKRTA